MNDTIFLLRLISSILIILIVGYILRYYITQVIKQLTTMLKVMNSINQQLITMFSILQVISGQLDRINTVLKPTDDSELDK